MSQLSTSSLIQHISKHFTPSIFLFFFLFFLHFKPHTHTRTHQIRMYRSHFHSKYRKVTYPKDEGVYDEEGFKAGDDRFGLHCEAYTLEPPWRENNRLYRPSRCNHALIQPHSVTGAAHHRRQSAGCITSTLISHFASNDSTLLPKNSISLWGDVQSNHFLMFI